MLHRSARLMLAAVVLAALVLPVHSAGGEKPSPRVLRIGAVAYAPIAVTVFEDMRRYFAKADMPIDYVLYSNYDALVDALKSGHVDIAWNTPLAHARYHLLCDGQSQTLVMRDVDCNFRCKLLVRKESGITAPTGLAGKTLALGSREAAEATVLPLHYLKKEGVKLDKVTFLRLDEELDLRGNPCSSPLHVLKALRDGRADAGVIGERLWDDMVEQGPGAGRLAGGLDFAAVQPLRIHGRQGLRQDPWISLHTADAGHGRQRRMYRRDFAAGGRAPMGRRPS